MGLRVKPRELTSEEVNEILKLKRKDITATKLKEFFAIFEGTDKARFQPNDTFTLMPNKFHNSSSTKTTVGRYIFNIFCMPEPYLKKYGYMNDELLEDNIGGLEKKMGAMILNDEMTTKEYGEFMDNSEWLGMNTSYYLSPSMSNTIVIPIPEVIKRKDELFAQYQKELDNGDINAANAVEKELLALAKEKIEAVDDPSYDCYKSGVFKFPVSYKKSAIMVGAVNDLKDGKLHILKSDYTDGLSPDEYDKAASLTVLGGVSRGVF